MPPNTSRVQISNVHSGYTVELAPAVMWRPAAPTPLLASHTQDAAGHRELGGLSKVGQHSPGRAAKAPLEGGLGWAGLGLGRLSECMMSNDGFSLTDAGDSLGRGRGQSHLLLQPLFNLLLLLQGLHKGILQPVGVLGL